MASWGIFVELDMGVEVTVYLPRFAFYVDEMRGSVCDKSGNPVYVIGEEKRVKITGILPTESRIIAEIVEE